MSTAGLGNFRRKSWTWATLAIILGAWRRAPKRSRRAPRGVASRTDGLSSTTQKQPAGGGAPFSEFMATFGFGASPAVVSGVEKTGGRARTVPFKSSKRGGAPFPTIAQPNLSFAGDSPTTEHKRMRHNAGRPKGRVQSKARGPGPLPSRIPPPRNGSGQRCGSAACSTDNSTRADDRMGVGHDAVVQTE